MTAITRNPGKWVPSSDFYAQVASASRASGLKAYAVPVSKAKMTREQEQWEEDTRPLTPEELAAWHEEVALRDAEMQARVDEFRSGMADCPPLPDEVLRGGQSDLPRSAWLTSMAAERDSHPLSEDWKAPSLARWHDAWDSILVRWGAGETIRASEYPPECISALVSPGITLSWDEDGQLRVRDVAFIRLDGDEVIPLDDPDRDSREQDPYPGWDADLLGDPEAGRRLGRLTREHALAITLASPLMTHEQSRKLFNSPGYRAAHPGLDGYRAANRDQWKKARQRLVTDGLVHKPEPDQHYRRSRQWHTITMPYEPGPAPGWEDSRPLKNLVRKMRKAAVILRT